MQANKVIGRLAPHGAMSVVALVLAGCLEVTTTGDPSAVGGPDDLGYRETCHVTAFDLGREWDLTVCTVPHESAADWIYAECVAYAEGDCHVRCWPHVTRLCVVEPVAFPPEGEQ